jgi:hypothetical protein
MKLFVMVGFLIGVFLVSSNIVLADENHSNGESHHAEESHANTQHEGHTKSGNEESYMKEMDHSKMTEESHMEEMDHSKMTEGSHMEEMDHSKMTEGSHMEEMDHSKMTEGSHMEEMDHSKMTEEEHQESIKQEDEETDHGSMGHKQGNGHSEVVTDHEAEGGHGHGGANLVEEPANMKVLGTFGAINLSFILIGIWNKWFKRKEEE